MQNFQRTRESGSLRQGLITPIDIGHRGHIFWVQSYEIVLTYPNVLTTIRR